MLLWFFGPRNQWQESIFKGKHSSPCGITPKQPRMNTLVICAGLPCQQVKRKIHKAYKKSKRPSSYLEIQRKLIFRVGIVRIYQLFKWWTTFNPVGCLQSLPELFYRQLIPTLGPFPAGVLVFSTSIKTMDTIVLIKITPFCLCRGHTREWKSGWMGEENGVAQYQCPVPNHMAKTESQSIKGN